MLSKYSPYKISRRISPEDDEKQEQEIIPPIPTEPNNRQKETKKTYNVNITQKCSRSCDQRPPPHRRYGQALRTCAMHSMMKVKKTAIHNEGR